MSYKLIFTVTKDHVKPAKLSEREINPYDDYSLIHCYELDYNIEEKTGEKIFESFGEGYDENSLTSFVSLLNSALPNLMKRDIFCFPKIDGDSAEICLLNTDSGKQLVCKKYELVNLEKTQKLEKKSKKTGKNPLGLKRLVSRSGYLTAVFENEVEAGLSEVYDYSDYNKQYAKNSKERASKNLAVGISQDNGEQEESTNIIELLTKFGIY